MCGAIAYIGGALYCFRAIYLNKCVYKRWDPDRHVWYLICPITSTMSSTWTCESELSERIFFSVAKRCPE
jgi:hypothetical protein